MAKYVRRSETRAFQGAAPALPRKARNADAPPPPACVLQYPAAMRQRRGTRAALGLFAACMLGRARMSRAQLEVEHLWESRFITGR